MKVVVTLALAAAAAMAVGLSAHARLQPQMFCWAGDMEFPVPCDEEGEDDSNRPAAAAPAFNTKPSRR